MTLKRVGLLVLTSLYLYACGGEGDNNSTSEPPPSPQEPATVMDALQRQEDSGAYPKLNRDADVAGPDQNANGVRDDLDAYITSLPDTPPQKQALHQGFTMMQQLITLDTTDETAVLAGMRNNLASMKCIYSRYDMETANKRAREIEKFTVNTDERLDAYEKFNSAANGNSAVLPQGDGCNE